MNFEFWSERNVFITGHTGFKGSWLSYWLRMLGSKVHGYALAAATQPALFTGLQLENDMHSELADIRDAERLRASLNQAAPEIVFHMAAQPLVRESYQNPLETYATNVMGTANLLEAVRHCPTVKAVVIITTDKCYENKEWHWGYRETDRLGGSDPYANSKACAELVTDSYRQSFFQDGQAPGIATARAGNVIGGGDWAKDRLVPDCVRYILDGVDFQIRYPEAIRPWQHVLEPLSGYMQLAQLLVENRSAVGHAYNFGPDRDSEKSVQWVVRKFFEIYGQPFDPAITANAELHESNLLRLDSALARAELNWSPCWSIEEALQNVVEWSKAFQSGHDLREVTRKQIQTYMQARGASLSLT